MKEIITIQVGQCGNLFGVEFWDILSREHAIGYDGRLYEKIPSRNGGIGVFYEEKRDLKFVPRAVLVDLQPATLNSIRNREIGMLFRPGNVICGNVGTGNNFAQGYYSELSTEVLDAMRKEAEASDCLQAFQICHSLGGGSGSGLGSLLVDRIREEFPRKALCSYSIMPTSKIHGAVVEPYNAIFSIDHLIQRTDATFCFDNEALTNIWHSFVCKGNPARSDLNRLIASVMSGITCNFRFPDQATTTTTTSANYRDLCDHMVPFRKLHFLVPGFAPLITQRVRDYGRPPTVKELARIAFDSSHMMATCQPHLGKYLSMAVNFRGDVSSAEVKDAVKAVQLRNSNAWNFKGNFVNMDFANALKTSICTVPNKGVPKSCTFAGNTTSVNDVLKRLKETFKTMWDRKAFVHWYVIEGMDENDFVKAEYNLSDVVDAYMDYEKNGDGGGGGADNEDINLTWTFLKEIFDSV